MKSETKVFIKQWLIKANEDLLVVDKLTEDDIIATSSICFHCQQASEKFLKAYLISKGFDVKKTHNIEYLLAECSDLDKGFKEIDPKELSDFGVDARYPGDMYIPDKTETLFYKKLAYNIKEIVESKVKSIIGNDS